MNAIHFISIHTLHGVINKSRSIVDGTHGVSQGKDHVDRTHRAGLVAGLKPSPGAVGMVSVEARQVHTLGNVRITADGALKPGWSRDGSQWCHDDIRDAVRGHQTKQAESTVPDGKGGVGRVQ